MVAQGSRALGVSDPTGTSSLIFKNPFKLHKGHGAECLNLGKKVHAQAVAVTGSLEHFSFLNVALHREAK